MSRFWVAGTGNWNDTAHWAASSGGTPGETVPTAADDVFFDASSGAGTATINVAAFARSVQSAGSSVATLVHNASVSLTIGDSTAGASNVALDLSGFTTYTLGSATTSTIVFVSTSATVQTITSGGRTLGNWTVNGAGSSYRLADANTVGSTSTVTLTTGTLDTNGQTCNWGSFAGSGASTRTIILGASAINVSVQWSCNSASSMTVTPGTSVITLTGANATFTHGIGGGSDAFHDVVFTGGGSCIFNGASGNTYNNVTFTGTASLNDQLLYNVGNWSIAGTFTFTGNSPSNRALLASNTIGTARTITAANVSVSNTDIRDTTGAGAGSWNLSGNSSGDAGGNTGITFTTAATQYRQGGGNWSDVTKWFLATNGGGGAGRVPLPQDDVVFDANSFTSGGLTLTSDSPRLGKSVTWTGITNSPTWSSAGSHTLYGSLTVATGMTVSLTGTVTFRGRSAFTLTNAGHSFSTLTVEMVGGSLAIQDAMSVTTVLNVNNGTFNANNQNVTVFTLNASGTTTRGITMGSGVWSITRNTAGTAWNIATTTGLTLNAGTSTIVMSDTGASQKTFSGNLTYNDIVITGGGSGAVLFSTSVTFNNVVIGAPKTVTFTSGTTFTYSALYLLTASGSVVTIQSSSAGSAATWSKSSGIVSFDYASVKDITASGGAAYYAGTHSTNVSGNTGITFAAAPIGSWGVRANA